MARKSSSSSAWVWMTLAVLVALYTGFVVIGSNVPATCPNALYYCPGVGCVSGADKCIAGSKGGASKVFSSLHEAFTSGSGTRTCPDNTRSQDGKCLLEFPSS
jgi:hypothetical protein